MGPNRVTDLRLPAAARRAMSRTTRPPSAVEEGAPTRVEPGGSPRPAYRPEFDGLRGVAVLAVIAYHYGLPFGQHGFLGVDVFFVLSGFLITSIIAAERQRTGAVDLGRFYVRRALRLLPAFWLMLVVVAPFVPFASAVAAFGYVINLTVASGLQPFVLMIGPTWTLAVEWQFYLLWPLVMLLALARWKPRTVVVAVIGLAIASAVWRAVAWQMGADVNRVYFGTDTHADGLLIGSAIGLLAVHGGLPRVRPTFTFAAIAFGVALLVTPKLSFDAFSMGGEFLAVAAAAVIVMRPPRALAFGPLVRVGVISYGVYLWHIPIWLGLTAIGYPAPWLAILLTFVAAAASHRYVERPFLRVKGLIAPDRPGVDRVVNAAGTGRAASRAADVAF